MAIICEFGTATKQVGYSITEIILGTKNEALDQFADQDVRLVVGASVWGEPDRFEFAVMRRDKDKAADFLKATPAQIARATREWSKLAGELVSIECTRVDAPFFALGSEQACRQLHRQMGVGNIGYSQRRQSWCYVNKAFVEIH